MGRRGFLSPARGGSRSRLCQRTPRSLTRCRGCNPRGVAAPKKVQGFHLLRPMPGLPWPALDAATQANLWPTKSAITSMPARDADVMALPQEPSDVFPQLSAYDQRDVASVFLSERCGDLRKRCSSISHISHLLNLLFCVFTTPVLFAHCHSGSAASRPILHVLRVVAVIQMIGVDAGRDIARMAYKFLRRTKCLRI